MKKVLLACALTLCPMVAFVLCIGHSNSQTVSGNTASLLDTTDGIDTNNASEMELVAAFDNDPGFAKHVDWNLATNALQYPDAKTMTDVALQLIEAEKILLRNHSQIHSDHLFRLAFRYATTEKNDEALARLQKAADKHGLRELKTQLALAGTSRGSSDDEESLKEFTSEERLTVDAVLRDIENALSFGEESTLLAIKQWIEESKPSGDTGRAILLKRVATACEEVKSISPEEAKALKMLAGTSRAAYSFQPLSTNRFSIAIMWHNPGRTSGGSYLPPEYINRGWWNINEGKQNIGTWNQKRFYVHFSNGFVPLHFHSKVRGAVKPGQRFEVQWQPGSPDGAMFRTSGSGNNYQTNHGLTFEQAYQEGWKAVDFYEIDVEAEHVWGDR